MQQNTISVSFNDEIFEAIKNKASTQNQSVNKYIEHLIEEEIVVLKLCEGHKYKIKENKLLNQNGKIVELTRKEKMIVRTLMKNVNAVVSIETLHKTIWGENNNKTIIYSLRNSINSIRKKTCYDIIRNHSKLGYTISTSA